MKITGISSVWHTFIASKSSNVYDRLFICSKQNSGPICHFICNKIFIRFIRNYLQNHFRIILAPGNTEWG